VWLLLAGEWSAGSRPPASFPVPAPTRRPVLRCRTGRGAEDHLPKAARKSCACALLVSFGQIAVTACCPERPTQIRPSRLLKESSAACFPSVISPARRERTGGRKPTLSQVRKHASNKNAFSAPARQHSVRHRCIQVHSNSTRERISAS
jgi:hypothetical protein